MNEYDFLMKLVGGEKAKPLRSDRAPATEATHDSWTDFTGTKYWVHRWRKSCRDGCAIHAPTPHHMHLEDWPQLMRESTLIERICEHGIGHPDPDSLAFFVKNGDDGWGVHGCDGCCAPYKGKHRKTTD